MKYLKKTGLLVALFFYVGFVFSQSDYPAKDWMLLDAKSDKIAGMSVTKAYSLLKKKTPVKVIVAVIDSGVDYLHEDLKDVMWTNPGEVPGNGIDDDGNGYIDDIHGWNFIGGKDGKNIDHDNLEITRLYRDFSAKFEGKSGPFTDPVENKQFNLYQKIKKEFTESVDEAKGSVELYQPIFDDIKAAKDGIKERFGLDNATADELDKLNIAEDDDLYSKITSAKLYLSFGFASDMNELYEGIKGALDYFQGQLDYNYNVDYDPRGIVGDDYRNSNERIYGNNDVKGPDASHGTHVAGIIAATRGNNIGMDGIADNVQIMSVRVVPDGDERDKDVANGIRYAVDNGAKVINMSFGKAYVYDKKVVDDAVKYAESKGVLLVHAAGNDGIDIDVTTHYPTDKMEDMSTASNWLEIGAMGYDVEYKTNKAGEEDLTKPTYKMVLGDFSNYGIANVDVFAPGVDIYSTTPENTYAFFNGTSMACPSTSGVAAVLFSYFPNLTAPQVKDIIMKSSTKYKKYEVVKPGTESDMVELTTISVSGGVVNLYNAVKMASKYK